jgi:uncharacterized membrane protein
VSRKADRRPLGSALRSCDVPLGRRRGRAGDRRGRARETPQPCSLPTACHVGASDCYVLVDPPVSVVDPGPSRSAMIGVHRGRRRQRRDERAGSVAEKRLVISIFGAEAEADEAAAALRQAGAVVDDAIGVLVLDEHGELKTQKVGATSGGKGAAAGAVLGLLGPIGLGVGVVGGALLGKLHHKDLGLADADRERIGGALRGGKAAVAVLAELDELVAVESILVDRGGETDTHELDEAVLREVADSAGA